MTWTETRPDIEVQWSRLRCPGSVGHHGHRWLVWL